MRLTNVDYINILKYYNLYKKNMKKNEIKKCAEYILSNKLCKCIKKLNKNNNEDISIPICINSVIKNKNLKIYGFKCKKGSKLKPNKKNIVLTKKNKIKKIKHVKNKTRKK